MLHELIASDRLKPTYNAGSSIMLNTLLYAIEKTRPLKTCGKKNSFFIIFFFFDILDISCTGQFFFVFGRYINDANNTGFVNIYRFDCGLEMPKVQNLRQRGILHFFGEWYNSNATP